MGLLGLLGFLRKAASAEAQVLDPANSHELASLDGLVEETPRLPACGWRLTRASGARLAQPGPRPPAQACGSALGLDLVGLVVSDPSLEGLLESLG